MKRFFYVGCAAALGAAFMIGGCESTIINPITIGPNFKSAAMRKMLVISIASTPEIRQMVEQAFARQLKKRDVTAVASYTLLPADTPLEKAAIAPYARQHEFDTVLVSRLISRRTLDKQPQVQRIGEPAKERTLSEDVNWIVASPDDPQKYEVAILRTSLYDVATEELLWSAGSQTLVDDQLPKRIPAYVKTMLNALFESR